MDTPQRVRFLTRWKKYFNNAEPPITFYYSNEPGDADVVKSGPGRRCVIAELDKVRDGHALALGADSALCPGGRKYLGFGEMEMPDFEYFLSCGIPEKVEGERYKKSPELVKEAMKTWPDFKSPGKYIVFKRWDKLGKSDTPEVVIFFVTPDALAGLFTLAAFDEVDSNAVFAPFGSGCSSIVTYPYLEKDSGHPRGVIGMFDISARPFVSQHELTFSVPMSKFVRMIDNVDESFLITSSWAKVQKRIK